jgi:hypothetical protein
VNEPVARQNVPVSHLAGRPGFFVRHKDPRVKSNATLTETLDLPQFPTFHCFRLQLGKLVAF